MQVIVKIHDKIFTKGGKNMTIKKLTLAAAIVVGMASIPAMAADTVASASSACPSCAQPMSSCGCENQISEEDMYNVLDEDKCDKGKKDKKQRRKLSMKQIYSYPNVVYGTNNYMGEKENSILSSEKKIETPATIVASSVSGVTVASNPGITGAAAKIITVDGLTNEIKGISIHQRDDDQTMSAPITIETEHTMQIMEKKFVPIGVPTGGAAGLDNNIMSAFPDVPSKYWAACDIDKLALNDVVVGYPDKKFRPTNPVTRAEFASMLVKGFNMNTNGLEEQDIFADVPMGEWSNKFIAKAFSEELLKGYPDKMFKPKAHVSRAEALNVIAKGIDKEITSEEAQQILSKYKDGSKVPDWAQIPVAKSLSSGALKDSPHPEMISPYLNASRADVSSMLQTIRMNNGYDKNPLTAREGCDCLETKAYVEEAKMVSVPTLQLKFLDQVSAKSSYVGEQFAATTMEKVTVNGMVFDAGSRVNGKIVEIIRPSGSEKGALKLAFTEIDDGVNRAELPKQILTAQIDKAATPNVVSRFVTWPFTWVGGLIGTTGRTVGGMIVNASNAAENVTSGVGIAAGEILQGEFKASGRSLQDSAKALVVAPIDFTRTALSGTKGLFQSTGDEVAYLVDPRGYKISAVNPREQITIAFAQLKK